MNSTRITELVEKATSPDLKSADMESINALIKAVNDNDQTAGVVSEQIKRRLQ
jgi:hypothetical protein